MQYVVKGLPLEPFRHLFGLSDEELLRHGAKRYVADAKPGYPCRITLEDAEPGETLLLVNWRHLDSDTPYRSDGPIFVSEAALATREARNEIPEQQRSRLLSVRAYDKDGWMLAADAVQGVELESLVAKFFADPEIDYLLVHNARRGCYACRIDRA